MDERRREFLVGMASVAAGAALAGCGADAADGRRAPADPPKGGEAEVTPGEDLMQEHGVLERILLIYDEAVSRIERGAPLDPAPIASAAAIVRRFIEEYHEKLEERHVFPRLERARVEVELVSVLRRQHERGRELTREIERRSRALATGAAPDLAAQLRLFVRMYRPHAAREETVLFPAFRGLVGRGAYRELGEAFEREEHARLGKRGFSETVAEVARLELALGIGDLAAFTP
jgi:hemerythrin-like domain-containing protein